MHYFTSYSFVISLLFSLLETQETLINIIILITVLIIDTAAEYENLPKLVRQYLSYITTIKNRSLRTAAAYAVDLQNFFRFYKLYKKIADSNTELKNIKIDDINIDLRKKIKYVFKTYFLLI